MSHGTFSDTLIRLEAFKRIFVFPPKIDLFARSKSRLGEGKRRNEFAEWHNYAKYELRNDIIMRDTIYA